MIPIMYVLYTMDPSILLNCGLMRPVRCILPEGSVVNPKFPAAVGMRTLACIRQQATVFGAFSQALPDLLPAAVGDGGPLLNIRTTDTRTGRRVMANLDPITGGGGGTPERDGTEGNGMNFGFFKNTPVEINEAEVPVRILRYGLVPDSGGAGRWRGGSALEMEFQLFAPQSMVTARNRDRSIFSAWGLRGGMPGLTSRFAKNPDTDHCVELGSIDIVPCDPGDIILIQGPGAGGYGNPLDRPAGDVLTDVRRGFVSAARARSDYGVVIGADLVIDAAATARLRGDLSRQRVIGEFGHGEGRAAFERVWTQQRYAALTRILSEVPVTWRFFVKHGVFGALKGQIAPPDGGAADVYRAYETIVARFEDLPRIRPDEGMRAAVAGE